MIRTGFKPGGTTFYKSISCTSENSTGPLKGPCDFHPLFSGKFALDRAAGYIFIGFVLLLDLILMQANFNKIGAATYNYFFHVSLDRKTINV